MEDQIPGTVITFYSYKGGVGRTMSLANVACLLARRARRGVLMVDWDLEAPGLHRFFHSRLRENTRRLTEEEIDAKPGLIDLFRKYSLAIEDAGEEQGLEAAEELVRKYDPLPYVLETDVPSLYLLKAGSFRNDYAFNVSTFNWEALYNRSPWLFGAFAEHLARRFDFVLIDSRTGITDTSGICTTLLPEKLVVVFTPNRQSMFGLEDPIQRITKHRRRSDDLRPLTIFPLPSRVETSELELVENWRLGKPEAGIPGYKPLFEQLLKDVYGLSKCDLGEYFDRVQIQHASRYAFGEEVSVLKESDGYRLSLSESYKTFLSWLIDRPVPWAQESEPNATTSAALISRAEAAFQQFPIEQQDTVRRVLTRLVRLAPPEEGGDDRRLRARLDEFGADEREVVKGLVRAKLLRVEGAASGLPEMVELPDDAIVQHWPRLRDWLGEDRPFLLWRQSLRAAMAAREGGAPGRRPVRLDETLLTEARVNLDARPGDLNEAERQFIRDHLRSHWLRQRLPRWVAIFVALLALAAALSWVWNRQRQVNAEARAVAAFEEGSRLEKENRGQAIARYTESIELKPDFADAYLKRGLAYARDGAFNLAIADYDRAVELKPYLADELGAEYADAYIKRGTAFRERGENQKAVDDYSAAAKYAPGNAELYYNRGLAYTAMGDFTRALQDYNRAIALRPDFAEAYFTRAKEQTPGARVQEDYNRVIEDYTKAIDLDPKFADAYLNRGLFFSAAGRQNDAIKDFTALLERNPAPDEKDIPEIYNYRGLAHSKKGDFDKAIADFKAAIDLRPEFIEARLNRASANRSAGRRSEAEEELKAVLAMQGDEELMQSARAALSQLLAPTSPYDTTVPIHYVESDGEVIGEIRERLARRGFLVQSIGQEQSDLVVVEVRYFYREDSQNAQAITKVVKNALTEKGVSVGVRTNLLARFAGARNAKYGVIEVWFPSLTNSPPPLPESP